MTGAEKNRVLDTIQKVSSVILAAGIIGLFKFYVDMGTEIRLLQVEAERANRNTELILTEMARLHPRR